VTGLPRVFSESTVSVQLVHEDVDEEDDELPLIDDDDDELLPLLLELLVLAVDGVNE
jgi:hypothetical protein